jgi:hypothetical protein
MRVLSAICLSYLMLSSDARNQLAAQEPAPRNQLTLDASILAGGFTYARLISSDRALGAGGGVGTEFNIRMVHGEEWGKTTTELAHVEIFARRDTPSHWQYDLGVRAAADIHSQAVHGQSGSEQEFGGFFGGYIAPMWAWHALHIGPRVQAGVYWAPAPAFGVSITPLTVRLLFKF